MVQDPGRITSAVGEHRFPAAGFGIEGGEDRGIASLGVVEVEPAIVTVEVEDPLIGGAVDGGHVIRAYVPDQGPPAVRGGSVEVERTVGGESNADPGPEMAVRQHGHHLVVPEDQGPVSGGEIESIEIGGERSPFLDRDRRLVRVVVREPQEGDLDSGERGQVRLSSRGHVDHVEIPLLVAVVVFRKEDPPTVPGPPIEHVPADIERLEAAAGSMGHGAGGRDRVGRGHEQVHRAVDRPEEADPPSIGTDLGRHVGGRRQERLEREQGIRGG